MYLVEVKIKDWRSRLARARKQIGGAPPTGAHGATDGGGGGNGGGDIAGGTSAGDGASGSSDSHASRLGGEADRRGSSLVLPAVLPAALPAGRHLHPPTEECAAAKEVRPVEAQPGTPKPARVRVASSVLRIEHRSPSMQRF